MAATPLRFIDLFCGLGAFHQAFKDATHSNTQHSHPSAPRGYARAFQCVFACDINVRVQRLYEHNHGHAPHGDIQTVQVQDLPDFDILCAGFPCQPFSVAGNQQGFQDASRGNLFEHILRFIDAKQPPMCLLENVPALRTHDQGRTFAAIQEALHVRGYVTHAQILNAAHFGSPQARKRLFLVATRAPLAAFKYPTERQPPVPVASILDSVSISLTPSNYSPKRLTTIGGGGQGQRVYDPCHPGITLCASSGGRGAKTGLYQVGDTARRLTVPEATRMFGFPDTYAFLDTRPERALFYLGNSIVVQVVRALVPSIWDAFQASP